MIDRRVLTVSTSKIGATVTNRLSEGKLTLEQTTDVASEHFTKQHLVYTTGALHAVDTFTPILFAGNRFYFPGSNNNTTRAETAFHLYAKMPSMKQRTSDLEYLHINLVVLSVG